MRACVCACLHAAHMAIPLNTSSRSRIRRKAREVKFPCRSNPFSSGIAMSREFAMTLRGGSNLNCRVAGIGNRVAQRLVRVSVCVCVCVHCMLFPTIFVCVCRNATPIFASSESCCHKKVSSLLKREQEKKKKRAKKYREKRHCRRGKKEKGSRRKERLLEREQRGRKNEREKKMQKEKAL